MKHFVLLKDQVAERKRMIIKVLTKMFETHRYKNHIIFSDVFFINATDIDDSEVKRLQAKLVEYAFNQSTWGQRRPMAFVPLELSISEMRSNGIAIIMKEVLEQMNEANKDLALSGTDLQNFLKVQHTEGKILYFDLPGLERFIIIQPNAMVNVLKAFVTNQIFWPEDHISIWKILAESGKIKKDD